MTPRPRMMWRYSAIDQRTSRRDGELAGATAAEVRASLRRIGLQVVDLRPIRSRWNWADHIRLLRPVIDALHHHLRGRRRSQRAEIYDSLATMLNSGLPLLDAIETRIESGSAPGSGGARRSPANSMLRSLREDLRSGSSGGSLAAALRGQPGWFDPMEIAMVEAGQHGGNLPLVLQSLAQRHERAGDLSHKLVGALAYPFLVMMVGLGVVVFLSVRTLPQLCKILNDSKIATPGLTAKVMWLGQMVAHHWMALGFGVLTILGICMVLPRIDLPWSGPAARLARLRPRVLRTLAVGNLAQGLAELIHSGVPMVESLRVIAPSAPGDLRRQLQMAAEAVERGEELSQALSDPHWFDAEFRRLLDIGQASGELDVLLERIGQRYQRQTKRLIDRLAAMLEPVVILTLAVLVGTVVMAAILPLLRLQEVLR